MTDIIIKRYRPEEFPRHLDFLERMTVTKGTVEDWHALKSLHYKTDGKPFAPTYYRCELDDRLVGVVVMAYPKLLLAPRHRMFPVEANHQYHRGQPVLGAVREQQLCGD